MVAHLGVLAEEKAQAHRRCRADVARQRQPAIASVLRQALINLVDNAIKFTPPGGTDAARGAGERRTRAILDVIDSGPGVPAEARERIFDRFYRADPAKRAPAWAVDCKGASRATAAV